MSNLELIETIILGDVNTSTLNSSAIVNMSHFNDTSCYGNMVAILSRLFCDTQLLCDQGVLSDPRRVSIIVDNEINGKIREENANTSLERLVFMLKQMAPPECGIIIDIFKNKEVRGRFFTFEPPFATNALWYTEKSNEPDGTDLITIQSPEINWGSKEKVAEIYDSIIENANSRGINYRVINYDTDIEEVYELLYKAKMHITPVTSTGFISALIGTPTKYYGSNSAVYEVNRSVKEALNYDQPFSENVRLSFWNTWAGRPGYTMMWSHQSQSVVLGVPRYFEMVDDFDGEIF